MEPCIFCGLAENRRRTKEHIVPEWLETYLGIQEQQIQPTHYSSRGVPLNQRTHPVDQLLCGGVCNLCNEGWMSNMERRNMELLKKLICRSVDSREILGTKEGVHLAKWCCKTAFALHAASNYRRIIPLEHYRIIQGVNGMIPTRVLVSALTWPTNEKFTWTQGTTWKVLHYGDFNRDEKKLLYQSGYKISLQFGAVIFLVAYNPFKNENGRVVRIMPNFQIHHTLHPRSGPCAWSKTKIQLPKRSISASLQYSAELGLAFFKKGVIPNEVIINNEPWKTEHSDEMQT